MSNINQPIIKSFKTRIYLNEEQEVYFRKAFGIRRWVYNWAIDEYYKELNESGKKLSNFDLAKILNHTKVNDNNYKWLSEVCSMIRQEALKDLIIGIKSSTTKLNKALKSKKYTSIDDIPVGKFKPKYKSKKNSNNSFRYHIKDRKCVLPINPISKHYFTMMTVGRGKGNRFTIKSKESLLFLNNKDKYRICEYTFSEKNGKYYLSISYERVNYKINKSILPKKNTKIGIDMGVHTFLTCYDGNESFELTSDIIMKKLKKQEKKSEHLRSCLDKKLNNIEKYNLSVRFDESKLIDYKYSKRYNKLKLRLSKSYERENNLKKEFREQMTYYLVKNYKNINIEEYSFHGRKKSYKKANIGYNRKLSKLGGYSFMKRLKEKAYIFNTNLVIIPKFTATTQTCSCCGYRRIKEEKLKLNERTYYCPSCGTTLGRDENASINIYNYN